SFFVYCTISFGYRQPTFISHLLIGLSPFTFLEDGRLLSEKVKGVYLHHYTTNDKMKVKTEWEVKNFDGEYFK
ncbi:hypothetical protein, partial [Ureibacillus thermosphaericus]|uniref:hypothetical protein n=1 Tax=Ureibacillus thermosphaericus TaxID=51173 RepID=UPI0030C9CC52